jgi:hypothetical protein
MLGSSFDLFDEALVFYEAIEPPVVVLPLPKDLLTRIGVSYFTSEKP